MSFLHATIANCLNDILDFMVWQWYTSICSDEDGVVLAKIFTKICGSLSVIASAPQLECLDFRRLLGAKIPKSWACERRETS